MSKKSTLILLSILHLCILGICILTIYNNKHSGVTVAHVSSDTKAVITQDLPDTIAEPETVIETAQTAEIETEIQTEIQAEIQTETESELESAGLEPETAPLYSFRFIGTQKNLNIRNAPSTDAKIIGKVPVGGCGSVLELTNESWILAQYNDIVGYCSRDWIELQEITK